MEGEQVQELKNTKLWDCNSALYDSFELKSFKQQLDAAISARSLSMPHIREPETAPVRASAPRKPSKFSRSISKILRAVFRLKPPPRPPFYSRADLGFYSVELGRGGLWTIPEVSEKGFDSPELDPVVRKTVSERFTSSTVAAGLALECT